MLPCIIILLTLMRSNQMSSIMSCLPSPGSLDRFYLLLLSAYVPVYRAKVHVYYFHLLQTAWPCKIVQ